MTAEEFKEAKSLIKETLLERDGTGTGGKDEYIEFGSLADQAAEVDTVADPEEGDAITAEQGQKTYGLLQKNFGKAYPEMVYPEADNPIPENFTLTYIKSVCETLNNEKTKSNGAFKGTFRGEDIDLTETSDGTLESESSSCNAACSGLCVGSCISFCNGCSGCTATCGSGCASGCMVSKKS